MRFFCVCGGNWVYKIHVGIACFEILVPIATFLGAFEILLKVTTNVVIYLSVRPHGTALLPLEGFS